MKMPTLNKDKDEKTTIGPSAVKIKKRKTTLHRSNTFNSTCDESLNKPFLSNIAKEKKSNGTNGGQIAEPRYTKAVYLLLEAKKLAREIEEKKNNGDLFRNKIRGSGRGYSFSRPGTPNFVDSPGGLMKEAKGRALQEVSRRCEECGRSIGAGKFSQHCGLSYCNVPCYSMLFSSLNAGFRATCEENDTQDSLTTEQKKFRNSLIPKLRTYNTYYAEKPFQICCTEVNQQLILEGILKVYWGLKRPITLQTNNASRWKNFHPQNASEISKQSFKQAKHDNQSGYDDGDFKENKHASIRQASTTGRFINNKETSFRAPTVSSAMKQAKNDNVICYKGLPKRSERTSFVPPYGSSTTLRVTSSMKRQDIVIMLLKKFQIIDKPSHFSLFTVYESGGVKRLKSDSSPLIHRLSLGPCEDVSKIFIMETDMQQDIPHEIASYCSFAMYELETFLQKFKEEEEREVQKLKERFAEYKEHLKKRMLELQQSSKVTRV